MPSAAAAGTTDVGLVAIAAYAGLTVGLLGAAIRRFGREEF